MKSCVISTLIFGLVASQATAAAAADRPNVLFIAIDDLRTNLGCYGDGVAITPNIDRLSARGTLFARAYCQQAVCNPSRQSLLTGRRPDTIRVWNLTSHFRNTAPGVVTLPEYLKQHGYFTQGIGKIFHDQRGMGDPPSWSVPEQFQFVPKIEDYRNLANRHPEGAQKGPASEFVDAPDDAYPDGQVTQAAIEALENLAKRGDGATPFFLAVGIRKPHLPFTAPKRYLDMYDPAKLSPVQVKTPPRDSPALAFYDSVELRGYTDMPASAAFTPEQTVRLRHAYYAATSFADAQVGRLLAALERTGLGGNTIIVLWSDHGYHLGELGMWSKATNYEVATRVPLIMVTPDQRRRGTRVQALVELLDLFPTLVDLCGLPAAEGVEGQSLRVYLDDPDHASRPAVFSQFPRPWPRQKDFAAIGYAVRTKEYRYIEWRSVATGEVVARELYALPGNAQFETVNLAHRPEFEAQVQALSIMLTPAVAAGEVGRLRSNRRGRDKTLADDVPHRPYLEQPASKVHGRLQENP